MSQVNKNLGYNDIIINNKLQTNSISSLNSFFYGSNVKNLYLTKQKNVNINTPCYIGEIAWDNIFIYVCVSNNTWKKAVLNPS